MAQQQEEYTLGLRVSGSTCHEHMTVAYLGNTSSRPTQEELEKLGEITAVITGKDMFGPQKDVPVWLIKLLSNETEIVELWKKYNVEQEHTKGLKFPSLHISIKPEAPERGVDDVIKFSSIFAKRTGKFDPYFEAALGEGK